MKPDRIVPAPPPLGPGLRRLAWAGSPVVLAAYAVTLSVARNVGPAEAIVAGAVNALPTMLFAFAAYAIIAQRLVGRRTVVQVAGHVALAVAYAALTYWLQLVMIGAAYGASVLHFTVESFSARASAWQLLQNVTQYGVVAALAYVGATPQPAALILADPGASGADRPLSRYFIRSGDDIQPIDVDAIVSIAGADDYAEVATIGGRHLVRMTLADFERTLDPARFIRAHRSRIVNLDRIARAEPAGGGRLLLHMEDGEAIPASRAGAKLLRDRMRSSSFTAPDGAFADFLPPAVAAP